MLGVGEDNPFEVSRPYAKSLLVDTNITSVRVRPQELNDLGLYAAHGGFGHHRDNAQLPFIVPVFGRITVIQMPAKACVDGREPFLRTIEITAAKQPLGKAK